MPRVTIERAGGVKCERCWRYRAGGLERAGVRPGLCDRCQDALAGDGPWITRIERGPSPNEERRRGRRSA